MTDDVMSSVGGEGGPRVVVSQNYPHALDWIDTSIELRNMASGVFASSGPSAAATHDLEQRIDTLSQEIRQLKQLIFEMSEQLKSIQRIEPEEPPEIFHLPPLSERDAVGRVDGNHETAPFYFVEDYKVGAEEAES